MLPTNGHDRLARLADGYPRPCLASPLMRRLAEAGFIEPTGRVHPGTDLVEYRITPTGLAELSAPEPDPRSPAARTAPPTDPAPGSERAA